MRLFELLIELNSLREEVVGFLLGLFLLKVVVLANHYSILYNKVIRHGTAPHREL
jgi:hypothetical protein